MDEAIIKPLVEKQASLLNRRGGDGRFNYVVECDIC